MKMYLGAYLSNYKNTATPLVDWFDDEAWSQVALPRLGDLAAPRGSSGSPGSRSIRSSTARRAGPRPRPGNGTTRATPLRGPRCGKLRGGGASRSWRPLGEFPGAEFAVYNFSFPGDWNELVKEEVGGVEDAADDLLYIDFWDGMTSVEGYSAIRFYNSIFYKTPHLGTWDAALTHDTNQTSPPSRAASRTGNTRPRESIFAVQLAQRGFGRDERIRRPGVSSTCPSSSRPSGNGVPEASSPITSTADSTPASTPTTWTRCRRPGPGTVDETDPTVEIADAAPRHRHGDRP